jgi:F-type H+-transporting ATPase subunit b
MRRLALLAIAFAVLAIGLPVSMPGAGTLTPVSVTAADDAYGEGGGSAKQDGPVPTVFEGLPSAITAIVVFGIVVLILSTAVWPKITAGLDDRANKIRSEIEAAEAARAQAKTALEEYEKSLAEARAESQKMFETTKAQQAELAAELRAKSDRELSSLRDRAMRDIESAKKQAISELYAESVALATAMASKILQREVSAADQDRLIEESLAELKAHQRN